MDSSPILKKNMPKNARKGKNSYRTCLAQTFSLTGATEIIPPNIIH